MKTKAEIFDKLQYLYKETKFNDHQLHCVIRFDGRVDADVLGRSVMMLLHSIPILSCVYRHNGGNDYWKSKDSSGFEDAFLVANDQTAFEDFTTSRINESTGPQIKVCLYRPGDDSLSVIMNHMVCDAAGFKRSLYLLADIYSHLIDDPGYLPDFKIDGDRSFKMIMKRVPFWRRVKSLLFHNSESNQTGKVVFPMSEDKNIFPFILTREISPEKFMQIRAFCKKNNVTVNDVFLAAYYRALLKKMKTGERSLHIPIMVDMRRYLTRNDFDALSNLSSTIITYVPVNASESFRETVLKISGEMKKKKSADIGMNGFVKLNLIFKLLNEKTSYKLAKAVLKNPPICMTNVGIIDDEKLLFKNAKIKSSFVCGSIKYRPHFQIALSTFADAVTISSNLYGSREDYDTINRFLSMVEGELPIRKGGK
jgi:NRPS condensation-like uncharacterized protein